MECDNCKNLKEDIRKCKGDIMSRLENMKSLKETFFRELEDCTKTLNITEEDY